MQACYNAPHCNIVVFYSIIKEWFRVNKLKRKVFTILSIEFMFLYSWREFMSTSELQANYQNNFLIFRLPSLVNVHILMYAQKTSLVIAWLCKKSVFTFTTHYLKSQNQRISIDWLAGSYLWIQWGYNSAGYSSKHYKGWGHTKA